MNRNLLIVISAFFLVLGIRGVTGTIGADIPLWQSIVGVVGLSVFGATVVRIPGSTR
jgi:hypothetical protein